jgi:hypothetical protein
VSETFAVVAMAFAVASISMTLAKSQAFAWARDMVPGNWKWLKELVNCPYCTSHWVAIALVLAYRPVLLQAWFPLDLVVSAFVVVTLAAPLQWVIFKAFLAMPEPSENPATQDSQS